MRGPAGAGGKSAIEPAASVASGARRVQLVPSHAHSWPVVEFPGPYPSKMEMDTHSDSGSGPPPSGAATAGVVKEEDWSQLPVGVPGMACQDDPSQAARFGAGAPPA